MATEPTAQYTSYAVLAVRPVMTKALAVPAVAVAAAGAVVEAIGPLVAPAAASPAPLPARICVADGAFALLAYAQQRVLPVVTTFALTVNPVAVYVPIVGAALNPSLRVVTSSLLLSTPLAVAQ